jgi:lysophospholipase L1-like esterase
LPATAPAIWPIENDTPFRYFGPTFKYEIYSSTSPTITTSGTLAAVNTTYGAASASPTSFTVSGANLTAGIMITPPAGFEVSQAVGGASGYAGSGTAITVGSGGTIASTTIYVRLAATAAVGTYSGNIVCSSTGATTRNVATAPSTVSPVGTIHALDVTSNGGSVGNGTGFSVGWEFTVSQTITVTALGQFDPNSNPQTNTVAIYQRVTGGGGAQLVSASVLNTSPAEASGVCPARYAAVAPVVLPAGDYVVMSTQNGEDFIGPGGSPTVTMGTGLTWTNGVAFSGAAGPLPATAPASWQINNNNPVRYLGPTFKYTLATPVPPTQLAVSTVNGGANPTVNTAFSVVVEARDAGGTPQNVTSATAVILSLKTGTGTLGGTVGGTIAAGTNSVTISGVTYSKAESGVVLTATRTGGDNLTAADSAAFTVAAQPPSNALGAIMPMGDSITLGVPVAGGYRDPLYTLLHNRGDTFTFVGSLTDYATSTLTSAGQTHHEGHSGYVIANGGGRSGLDENLAGWIGPGAAAPDKILLMIGSNDINIGYDMPNAPTRLSTLITHIYGYRPNVKLFVASIIPMVGHEPDVQAFNATIPGIVASHQALGRNVVYVPMYDAMNINTDLADGLHPNALGYQHMAQAWDTELHPNYSTWASAHGVTGGMSAVGPDGISNMLLYALDLKTDGTNGSPGTLTGKLLSFTKRPEAMANGDVTYTIETSPDLQDPWTIVTPDVNDGTTISFTLPTGGNKIFARLKVTSP